MLLMLQSSQRIASASEGEWVWVERTFFLQGDGRFLPATTPFWHYWADYGTLWWWGAGYYGYSHWNWDMWRAVHRKEVWSAVALVYLPLLNWSLFLLLLLFCPVELFLGSRFPLLLRYCCYSCCLLQQNTVAIVPLLLVITALLLLLMLPWILLSLFPCYWSLLHCCCYKCCLVVAVGFLVAGHCCIVAAINVALLLLLVSLLLVIAALLLL